MKRLVTLFLILIISSANAQKEINSKNQYMSIKMYRDMFNKNPSEKELQDIRFAHGDTLILVEDISKYSEEIAIYQSKFSKDAGIFVNIKSYRKLYNKDLTSLDSSNFKIRGTDTLIRVNELGHFKNKISIPYEPIDSTFLEIYKDVVYGKYSKDTLKQKKQYMRLWKEPIKIYFSKSVDEEYKNTIEKLALKITNEIDSLKISIVSNLEDSNYIVYQIDENNNYRYSKNLHNNEYISFWNYWKNNTIYDTKLEINTTRFKNKRINSNYVIQNFIKSLGHFHSTSMLSCENVLSECNNGNKKFTKNDFKILKYHYSYGICKFTDLKTFEENHRKAREIFRETGRHLNFVHNY